MVVGFLIDHNGVSVVTPVNDSVADVRNAAPANVGLAFEAAKEVGKCGSMVCDGLDVFVTGGGIHGFERELGGRRRYVCDGRSEDEDWGTGEAIEGYFQRRRARVEGQNEAFVVWGHSSGCPVTVDRRYNQLAWSLAESRPVSRVTSV